MRRAAIRRVNGPRWDNSTGDIEHVDCVIAAFFLLDVEYDAAGLWLVTATYSLPNCIGFFRDFSGIFQGFFRDFRWILELFYLRFFEGFFDDFIGIFQGFFRDFSGIFDGFLNCSI